MGIDTRPEVRDDKTAHPGAEPDARPGIDATTRTQAIDAENRAVGRLYRLLDAETATLSAALRELARADTPRTPAALTERNALLTAQAQRLAQLRAAEEQLCFGRIDLDDGARHYLGRVGLPDRDGTGRALLDWRAPAAAAFYQATRAEPLGVARRRHLGVRGRRVTAVADELLNPAAAAVDGGAHLDADAALFAALDAPRDGQMHDVVATIQAEQDRIIRAPLPGVLVVQGGPGTGKTVVALHRAAYLLYSRRDRLRGGVLIVGPGQRFVDYIAQVLPSLGENGATLQTLGQLHDRLDARATDPAKTAALKGDLRMARVVAAAVDDLRRVPPEPVPIDVDGTVVHLHPADVAAAIRTARGERLPHNEGRVVFVTAVLEGLVRQLADAFGHEPGDLGDRERGELLHALHASVEVRRAVNRCWPMVTPPQLVRRLLSTPGVLDRCAPGLRPAERALLRRPREAAWTVSDVPLLDEAAALLGDDPEPRRRAAARAAAERAAEARYADEVAQLAGPAGAMVDAATLADRYTQAQPTAVDDSAGTGAFGHVVVDEAQELTPMQWRTVLRRCPTRSLTVVGDMAQATAPGAATSWEQALGPHLDTRWTLRELTVNYRLPRPINEHAERMLRAAGLAAPGSRSVRDGHDPLRLHAVTGPDAAALLAASLARRECAAAGERSVAIICLPEEQAGVRELLDRRATDGPCPVRLLVPDEAKGLEFDVVVVVDPDAVGTAVGPRGLFVALTRATQRLYLVTVPGPKQVARHPPGGPNPAVFPA